MVLRKKRMVIITVVVIVLLLCGFYYQVNRFKLAPSLYEAAETVQGVTVHAEADPANNRISYVLENHTAQAFDYDNLPALEYHDGQAWQEVLTKRGNRRFDGGRNLIGYSLAPAGEAGDSVRGNVDLASWPPLKDGTYRLVFLAAGQENAVVCSEPFAWRAA